MTSIARIVHNFDKGSADKVIITYEGEDVWNDDKFPDTPETFIEVARCLGRSDHVFDNSLNDEQMQRWSDDN